MIRRRFDYHAPDSLHEAIALVSARDARCLAGGTWIVPLMTSGEIAPASIVDLRSAGLQYVRADGEAIVIGATATYSDLAGSELVRDRLSLLANVASSITGGAQIRNQATLGGSACYAFPSSEAPAAIVALGARMRLASSGSTREVGAREFFAGAFTTAVAEDELLHEIAIAVSPGMRFGYYKLKLCQSSWPVATAAFAIELDAAGICRSATAVLGGVAATPLGRYRSTTSSSAPFRPRSTPPKWRDAPSSPWWTRGATSWPTVPTGGASPGSWRREPCSTRSTESRRDDRRRRLDDRRGHDQR